MMVSQSAHAGMILIANEKEFQVAAVCSKPALCLLVLLNENQFIKFLCFYIFLNVFSKTSDCLLRCGNMQKKKMSLPNGLGNGK